MGISIFLFQDNDGLPIYEELKHGTNPFISDTDNDGIKDGEEINVYFTNPKTEDTDKDNLTDYKEIFIYLTNPLESDTDNDNLNDYEEIQVYKTNPNNMDIDGDELLDGEEIKKYGTNPFSADSDNDGIYDGEEIKKYETDPLKIDTDDDGLKDIEEIKNYGTDPTYFDTDNDDLSDYEEIKIYRTNALNWDSDDDGLSDDKEIKYSTNPLNNDTDGDGLKDGTEVAIYGTNPLFQDTDKDYLSDGYEIKIGTNPTHDWRDQYNEEAFLSALSRHLRNKILYIVQNFTDYNSSLDKIWNILSWIDENIEYNYTKAENDIYKIQAANDTIFYHSGICSDYAILSGALLLEANVSPIYMLDIEFIETGLGHAAVAIKLDEEFFVLDQHLPLQHIGSYYWDWVRQNKTISNITFYSITLNENREPIINGLWTWDWETIKQTNYNITEKDIDEIKELTKKKFLELYPYYKEDIRLEKLAEKQYESLKETGDYADDAYLPRGFKKGQMLYYHSSLYHPKIAEKIIEWKLKEWEDLIIKYNKFYIVTGERDEIKIYREVHEFKEIMMIIIIAK